jgi:hypothetical protein
MKTFERIKELGHRLKTLESGCNTPVTDIQQSELQTAINDANVMHKYAKAIEAELRGIYTKLFGKDWNPDGPAGYPHQPTIFELNEENSQLPTDLVMSDPAFMDEFENHREAMKASREEQIKDAMEGRR